MLRLTVPSSALSNSTEEAAPTRDRCHAPNSVASTCEEKAAHENSSLTSGHAQANMTPTDSSATTINYNKQLGPTFRAGAPCTTNSMYVVFKCLGQVHVDHVANTCAHTDTCQTHTHTPHDARERARQLENPHTRPHRYKSSEPTRKDKLLAAGLISGEHDTCVAWLHDGTLVPT